LTMIRGLNEKFRHMMSHLKFLRPFPTFAAARTLLLLEEIDLNDVMSSATHHRTHLPSTHLVAPLVAALPSVPLAGLPAGRRGATVGTAVVSRVATAVNATIVVAVATRTTPVAALLRATRVPGRGPTTGLALLRP
jgi:hypothetical protein